MSDPDWWVLIDKKAALKEQFPSLAKVRNERPGCAADNERKRLYREAAELRVAAERQREWARAVALNEVRRERLENRARAARYRVYKRERQERRTA